VGEKHAPALWVPAHVSGKTEVMKKARQAGPFSFSPR